MGDSEQPEAVVFREQLVASPEEGRVIISLWQGSQTAPREKKSPEGIPQLCVRLLTPMLTNEQSELKCISASLGRCRWYVCVCLVNADSVLSPHCST